MNALLDASGVAKSYGAVAALRNASLSVRPGEVHALMGANGAGKSTLVKILTGAAMKRGKLSREGRDRLLAEMTDEVAQLVLRTNYLQSQSISVSTLLGQRMGDRFGRFMRALERAGQLDRALEFLPNEEMLAQRAGNGLGLTRPEIAVLMAYAKLDLYQELLDSDLPDDPWLEQDLLAYFPRPLQEGFGRDIRVKGRGMMRGLDCRSGEVASRICSEAFARGLVIETSGAHDEVVKVLAPLTIDDVELTEGLDILEQAVVAVLDSPAVIAAE